MNKSLRMLAAGAAIFVAATATAKETLNLRLDGVKEITLEGKPFKVSGNFVDVNGEKALGVGYGESLSIPASSLFGGQGTMLFRFRLEKPVKEFNHPRVPVVLRGEGRLYIGFGVQIARPPMKLDSSFREYTDPTYSSSTDLVKYGQWHYAAVTWNGSTVRFYMDGKVQNEEKQKIEAKFPPYSRLNIGPFQDKWMKCRPWQEDNCLVSEVRTFDAALQPEEIALLCGKKAEEVKKQYPTILTVPGAKSAPVIDGRKNDGEWQQAAAPVSVIDVNDPKQSLSYPANKVAFAYDADNLYICFDSVIPDYTRLVAGDKRTKSVEPDVWTCESFEFYLQNGKDQYRFGGNAAGGYCESVNGDTKIDLPWSYASSTKVNIDNSCLWQGEAAIPWSSLGMTAPADGTELKVNFCRTWRSMEKIGVTSLSGALKYGDAANFITIKLNSNTPSLQITEQNNPIAGTLKQNGTIASTAGGKYEYSIDLLNSRGLAAPVTLASRKFIIPPNGKESFQLMERIQGENYDLVLYRLKDLETGKILEQQAVPFLVNTSMLEIYPLFGQQKLTAVFDYKGLLSKAGKAAPVTLELTAPDNKIIFSQTLSGASMTIPFAKTNIGGFYKMEVVAGNGQRKLKIIAQSFYYPGLGEWQKDMPAESRIMPPFKPMTYAGQDGDFSVSLWNRKYQWRNSMFPVQISSGGSGLLSGEPQLLIDGKPVSAETPVRGRNAPNRGEFSVIAGNSECKIKMDSFIEYDGVLWNKISFTALKDICQIKLRIPVSPEIAELLHAGGAGFGSTGGFSARIKEMQIKFYPVIWIGNQEKGLCWFAETLPDGNVKKLTPISIVKVAGNTVLEITMAEKIKAGSELALDFGLMGTPVKPLPANFPLNTFGWDHSLHQNLPPPKAPTTFLAINFTPDVNWGFYDLPLNSSSRPDKAYLDKLLALAHRNNAKLAPYMDPVFVQDEYPEAVAYRQEWAVGPENPLFYTRDGKKHLLYWCCPASEAGKFYIWKLKAMLKDYPVDALYFDYGPSWPCKNAQHGCVDRYPLLALRDFYRQVAWALRDAGRPDSLIILHNSETVQIPVFTHITHLLDGEHLRQSSTPTLHNGKDIQDTMGLEYFASEYSSIPWGVTASMYLPSDPLQKQYGGGVEDQELYRFRMTKALLSGTLPHGSLPSLARQHFGLIDKVVRFYDRFDVPHAEFMPYWKNQQQVKVVKGKDIYVTLYRHASKPELLAVISHIGKEHLDQDVEVQFAPEALGLSKLAGAKELFTGADPEYARLLAEKNRMRLPVKLGDFGIDFKGLEDNTVKMHLKHHSVAIVHLDGSK